MNIIESNKICKITDKGIEYIGMSNEIQYINFKECNINWINYTIKKGLENKENKYVGQRDSTAKPIYIEFFTRPFIRFEFNNDGCTECNFDAINKKLQIAGWKTLDLS